MAAREVDYLLIGGGLAAANCARWLREEGAGGEVLLVGREADPPYNRPECSKGYLRGEETREQAAFRPREWWDTQSVELLLRTSVTSLDAASRTATLSNKDTVRFQHALLATGANVRRLNVEGCHLEGIHYLRSYGNADAIRERAAAVPDAQVVLIGGSFIACEVAASLTALGCRCTIVMIEEHPLERAFGPHMARFFHRSLEGLGIRLHGGEHLASFSGSERVERVTTERGLELAADLVVIGAGVAPDVQLARKAGLAVSERGGVVCSSRLQTSVPGIFAAGDVCEYESVIHGGVPVLVEHWDVAFNHGKTVALNMLGRDVPHEVVPYFYSVLAGLGELEYVGPAFGWDEEIVRGSYEEGSFSNWYLQGGRVRGVLAWERSGDLDDARRLLVAGTLLSEPERLALADIDAGLEAIGARG